MTLVTNLRTSDPRSSVHADRSGPKCIDLIVLIVVEDGVNQYRQRTLVRVLCCYLLFHYPPGTPGGRLPPRCPISRLLDRVLSLIWHTISKTYTYYRYAQTTMFLLTVDLALESPS